jgi:hypothetical protein
VNKDTESALIISSQSEDPEEVEDLPESNKSGSIVFLLIFLVSLLIIAIFCYKRDRFEKQNKTFKKTLPTSNLHI